MTLTPIRVRGKRKWPPTQAPQREAPAPSKMKKTTLGTVLARRATRHGATLESLPDEMLENILLYSANLSLPRASPAMGVKLSGRATLLRLFIWAFYETWEQWFGIPASEHVGYVGRPDDGRQPACQGDHVLQSAVLELPWARIDLILQAQQAWADRYGRRRWYQHSVPLQLHGPAHATGGYFHFNARECFEADYQQFKRWRPFFGASLQWRSRDVHPRTRMPMDLVTGPWDEEQMRRLFWLSRGGINMGDKSQATPPWEVKMQCLDSAIVSATRPNRLVVNCLMQDWIFTDLPDDLVRVQLAALDRRMEWGGDSPDDRLTLRHTRNALDTFSQLPGYLDTPP